MEEYILINRWSSMKIKLLNENIEVFAVRDIKKSVNSFKISRAHKTGIKLMVTFTKHSVRASIAEKNPDELGRHLR